jgi:hypothetical protein
MSYDREPPQPPVPHIDVDALDVLLRAPGIALYHYGHRGAWLLFVTHEAARALEGRHIHIVGDAVANTWLARHGLARPRLDGRTRRYVYPEARSDEGDGGGEGEDIRTR